MAMCFCLGGGGSVVLRERYAYRMEHPASIMPHGWYIHLIPLFHHQLVGAGFTSADNSH